MLPGSELPAPDEPAALVRAFRVVGDEPAPPLAAAAAPTPTVDGGGGDAGRRASSTIRPYSSNIGSIALMNSRVVGVSTILRASSVGTSDEQGDGQAGHGYERTHKKKNYGRRTLV